MSGRLSAVVGAGLMAAIAASCVGPPEPQPIPDYLRDAARAQSDCLRDRYTAPPYATIFAVTPVPYPTPRGDSVKPAFSVPTYPGSREIDGFEKDGWTVQVFEVEATLDELFEFYEDALFELHMVARGAGFGPAGHTCTFEPYFRNRSLPPRPVVVVSTEWVWRGEPNPQTPWPGFQGKAIPFAPPVEGVLWFYVSTRR